MKQERKEAKLRGIQCMQDQPEWWDPYSCQPYKMAKEDKPRSGLSNIVEYLKVTLSNLVALPLIGLKTILLKRKASTKTAQEFVGLSLSMDLEYAPQIVEMVKDLGVRRLLLRIPSWDTQSLDDYVKFAEMFPDCHFVINILQGRDSVENLARWKAQVDEIIQRTNHLSDTYWIGNAVNRTKWGCTHTGQALDLQVAVEELRDKYSAVNFLGSSIIDFEPLLSWRTLWNFKRYKIQGNAALLYVNRRHSPYGTQYGVFDLENKLRLAKAMTQLSNRCDDNLWITETNWPLLDTKPFTPNSGSPNRTCDEQTQADYLKLYYQIAWQSGWVEGVYWWQLINPGYGLVDHRDGNLRKLPSYYAFKEIMQGDLSNQPIRVENPYQNESN